MDRNADKTFINKILVMAFGKKLLCDSSKTGREVIQRLRKTIKYQVINGIGHENCIYYYVVNAKIRNCLFLLLLILELFMERINFDQPDQDVVGRVKDFNRLVLQKLSNLRSKNIR